MPPRVGRTLGISFRHYLWVEKQAWRITNVLLTKLTAEEVRLPQFAGTAQRTIEATIVRKPGAEAQIRVRGSTLVFDQQGYLDLSDEVEAISGLLGPEV